MSDTMRVVNWVKTAATNVGGGGVVWKSYTVGNYKLLINYLEKKEPMEL